MIIRGLTAGGVESPGSPVMNNNFQATDRRPSINDQIPASDKIVAANNNFVVEPTSNKSDITISDEETIEFTGGTLGQYSKHPDKRRFAISRFQGPKSLVDGAITATTAPIDPTRRTITLTGGVTLDQETTATDTYFKRLTTGPVFVVVRTALQTASV